MTRLKEVTLAILLLYCVQVFCQKKELKEDFRKGWDEAFKHLPPRIIIMMRSYYDAGAERIRHVNNKRFEFESTKEFEEGYIMGEIIERYRMMVEQQHAMDRFKNYNYMDCLLRMEQIQKIYFEIYHLVNMMFEVPRKYGEVSNDTPIQLASAELPPSIGDVTRLLQQSKKQSKGSKKKLRNHLKKLEQQAKIDGLKALFTPFVSKQRPRPWPLDYGWEIEHW